MKKILFALLLIITLSFNYVSADCNDSTLLEKANKIKINFITYDLDHEGIDESNTFAYLLQFENSSDLFVIKGKDGRGESANVEYIKGYDIDAVGGYTTLSDNVYTFNIYGSSTSACPNEIVRTITYTVPRYNDFIDTEYCDLNPEADICNPFKDTSKVDQEQFEEEIIEYIEGKKPAEEPSMLLKIWNIVKGYILYAIIPCVVIIVIYAIRTKKFIRKEREK